MSDAHVGRRMDAETVVLLILIAVFMIGAVASLLLAESNYVLTAVCVGLIVTAVLHRFLGGVEGSTLTVRGFQACGGVAVFSIVTWFINDQLVKQSLIVDPDPTSWVAIDRGGTPIPVTIGEMDPTQVAAEFMQTISWNVHVEPNSLRVVGGGHNLGKIDGLTLERLGLFNAMAMGNGRGILYTRELTANVVEDLSPVYQYKIETTNFVDSYNGFRVLDENGDVVLQNTSLRTKNFQFFEHDDMYFLVFVSRAAHNDPEKEPWAVFGFAQVTLSLKLSPLN